MRNIRLLQMFGLVIGLGLAGCGLLVRRDRPSVFSSVAESAPTRSPQANRQSAILITQQPIGKLSSHPIGMNLHVVQNATRPGMVPLLRKSKARIVRWPGGSESDYYHWKTHSLSNGWATHPNSAFDQFMGQLVQPAQMDVAITLNYGSNPKRNGGASADDAADWVAHAKAKGYRIAYWTIGNEVFGSWEIDLNNKPHDPTTYSNRVAKEFYPKIKKANPSAPVGVVVNQYDLQNPAGWTKTILSKAKYDFVEIHYYPQSPDSANDDNLLNGAIAQFKQQVTDLKRAMGNRQVPILLGEFNNVPNTPNKQSLSIVNTLYHGLMFAEGTQLGLAALFPWELLEEYCTHPPQTGLTPKGDFKDTLYGWQSFGTYSMYSLGLPIGSGSCAQGMPPIPFGTPFPSARAAELFGEFAAPREQLLQVQMPQNLPTVRAYAATQGNGYRILLFNLDRNATAKIPLKLSRGGGSWRAEQLGYGKAEYDQSKVNRWVAPTRQSLGKVGPSFQVSLAPWSMNMIALDP